MTTFAHTPPAIHPGWYIQVDFNSPHMGHNDLTWEEMLGGQWLKVEKVEGDIVSISIYPFKNLPDYKVEKDIHRLVIHKSSQFPKSTIQ